MTARDYLSEDGLAVLLLCSMLGLDERKAPGFVPPLTLSEWNKLEGKIFPSSLKAPSGLFGQNARELGETLDLPSEEAERVLKLLGRASRLTLELENLFTRGIWVLTRVDDHYPIRLRKTLKHLAPSVLFGSGEINLLRKPGLAVIGSRNIDAPGISFAQEVGQKSAAAKLSVVSGGAKGTDRLAMQGALEAGGTAFGVLLAQALW